MQSTRQSTKNAIPAFVSRDSTLPKEHIASFGLEKPQQRDSNAKRRAAGKGNLSLIQYHHPSTVSLRDAVEFGPLAPFLKHFSNKGLDDVQQRK